MLILSLNDKLAEIEAVLFACGEPIDAQKITRLCGITKPMLKDYVRILNDRYDSNGSALCILTLENCYQMSAKREYAQLIRHAADSKKNSPLSNAAMETLAIIAYNQPATKSFIESLRGVDSSSIVNSLVEKGLVEEAGRLNIPGKPIAFRTSANFLRCFNLKSLSELPALFDDETDKLTFARHDDSIADQSPKMEDYSDNFSE